MLPTPPCPPPGYQKSSLIPVADAFAVPCPAEVTYLTTYTVETLTLDTLSDALTLHPDPADAASGLSILRENVVAGRIRLENVLVLRSQRGVEGTALVSNASQVPVLPRFRPDVSAEAMTILARAVRERVEPERVLLLQDDQTPLNREAVEAAGWHYDSTEVIYETDLMARSYPLSPFAREGQAPWLEHPDLQHFLQQLDPTIPQFSGGLMEGWTLVALYEEANAGAPILALGAYGPSKPGYGGVDMIGVHPAKRGRGLGTQLHAHLLSRLAPDFARHGGLTSANNHAMRRIFEKNGSRHTATQLYFLQP